MVSLSDSAFALYDGWTPLLAASSPLRGQAVACTARLVDSRGLAAEDRRVIRIAGAKP